jgi:hypothetical protein
MPNSTWRAIPIAAVSMAGALFAVKPADAPRVTFSKDVAPVLQEALPGLPSSGRSRAVFPAHLPAGAPLGQGDEGSGAVEEDAALVRRSALWQVFERPVAAAERCGYAGGLGGWRRAGRRRAGFAAAAGLCGGLVHPQAGCGVRVSAGVSDSRDRHPRISESDRAFRIHGRQMGAVRRGAAGRSRAHPPYDFVCARTGFALAAG